MILTDLFLDEMFPSAASSFIIHGSSI